MRKLVFGIILCLSVLFACSAAYAADFEITGGIDFEKERISTFDSSKTITGTADEGTEITIKENEDGAGVVSMKSVLAAKKQSVSQEN